MTNFLRLWSSEAVESFDFQAFNKGDYYDAVHEKVASETISKVLYPTTKPRPARSCACISSTSSRRARCRT